MWTLSGTICVIMTSVSGIEAEPDCAEWQAYKRGSGTQIMKYQTEQECKDDAAIRIEFSDSQMRRMNARNKLHGLPTGRGTYTWKCETDIA